MSKSCIGTFWTISSIVGFILLCSNFVHAQTVIGEQEQSVPSEQTETSSLPKQTELPARRSETTSQSRTFESRYQYCSDKDWLDDAYCYLNYGVDSTANTINRWFEHDEDNTPSIATTRGRLRIGWEPRTGELDQFDLRFRIRAKFPELKDRVELLLSDEEDTVDQNAVKAAQNRNNNNNDRAVLAVQFKKEEDSNMSYRVGFGRGSQLYTRARYNNDFKLSDTATFYYYAEANYYSGDKFGFEVDGVVSAPVSKTAAFEFDNSFQYRDNRQEWYWRHELRYLTLGEDDTSYLFTAMIDGLSEPSYRKESVLVSMRYKKRVLREWLYMEIEPYVIWLREEDFRTSYGIALRAEIHFST